MMTHTYIVQIMLIFQKCLKNGKKHKKSLQQHIHISFRQGHGFKNNPITDWENIELFDHVK